MIEKIKQDQYLWSLFSSEEEYDPILTDKYGRFQHCFSCHRNVFDPLVSKFLIANGVSYEYPEGQPFAVCLTHDVDSVYRTAFSKGYAAISSLIAKDFKGVVKNTKQLKSKKAPWCNFQDILDLEGTYGARSSFYFLALAPGDLDFTYDVMDLQEEINMIANAGCEVGLHGGHTAYNDLNAIQSEKKRLEEVLGRPVVGYRNHYLRFRVPETWQHLSRAGFRYDTTFGYADCVGFRNGMCHPFKPYDRSTKKEIDIIEIPLAIVDGALFDNYMRLGPDTAWQIAKRIIDDTERCNGVVTILWHNTKMMDETLIFYKKILDYCYKKRAWLASGNDICAWYSEWLAGRLED